MGELNLLKTRIRYSSSLQTIMEYIAHVLIAVFTIGNTIISPWHGILGVNKI